MDRRQLCPAETFSVRPCECDAASRIAHSPSAESIEEQFNFESFYINARGPSETLSPKYRRAIYKIVAVFAAAAIDRRGLHGSTTSLDVLPSSGLGNKAC
ncbi:hypothetical protein EVAR_7688_1 [Eumeta japonica]|uniref:Uncharacterized protein n=1 Tax=Eumeta variegata TaxID=151549 RepID=A0A4C1TLE4_EUMVA|nr:hypothetical protein EVAR_7688_1 [Eumeta japonica]